MKRGLASFHPDGKPTTVFRHACATHSHSSLPDFISANPYLECFVEFCRCALASVLADAEKQDWHASSEEEIISLTASLSAEEWPRISTAESSSQLLSNTEPSTPYQHSNARQITTHLRIQLCLPISISVQIYDFSVKQSFFCDKTICSQTDNYSEPRKVFILPSGLAVIMLHSFLSEKLPTGFYSQKLLPFSSLTNAS